MGKSSKRSVGKTVQLKVAHVRRAILALQEVSATRACALNVSRSGHFRVQCAPDTESPWLSVAYADMKRGSVRAADRLARELINQAADHLSRYPNAFGDAIARVAV